MKEAQAEQQSQSQRQAWHINLCQSAPTATPNAPTRPGKLAHQERNSSTCHAGISVPAAGGTQGGSTDTHLPIQLHDFSIHSFPMGICQGCGLVLGAGAHVLAGIQPKR